MSNEKRKIIAKAIAANNAASKAVVGANKVENVFSKASLLFNTVSSQKCRYGLKVYNFRRIIYRKVNFL